MRHRRVGRTVRPAASASGEICERAGRRGADRSVGCATSCAANTFMPFSQGSESSLVPSKR